MNASRKLDFPELLAPRTRQLKILLLEIAFSPAGKTSLGRASLGEIASFICPVYPMYTRSLKVDLGSLEN
jgi:hypothetical protein